MSVGKMSRVLGNIAKALPAIAWGARPSMRSPLNTIEPTGATSPMIVFTVVELTCAVPAEEAHDLAHSDLERHALQDVTLAVVGVQGRRLQACCAVPR